MWKWIIVKLIGSVLGKVYPWPWVERNEGIVE